MIEDTKELVKDFAKKVSGGSQSVFDLIMTCLPDNIYEASKEEIEEVFNEIDVKTIEKIALSIKEKELSQKQEQKNKIQANKGEGSVLPSVYIDNNSAKGSVNLQGEGGQQSGKKNKNNSETMEYHIVKNINAGIDDESDYIESSDSIGDLITQKSFGYNGICRIIPQRPPFLMIDKVINLDIKNKIAICQKCVSANEGFFAGHFPNNPIMPGVLMIEAMAQTASIIGKALMNGKKGTLLFASADNVKFSGIATAGDILTIEAKVTKLRDPLVVGECNVKKQEEIICSCSLKAFRKEI